MSGTCQHVLWYAIEKRGRGGWWSGQDARYGLLVGQDQACRRPRPRPRRALRIRVTVGVPRDEEGTVAALAGEDMFVCECHLWCS